MPLAPARGLGYIRPVIKSKTDMNPIAPQTVAFCTAFQSRPGQGASVRAVLLRSALAPEALTDRLLADQVTGDLYSAFLPGLLLP